MAEQQAPALQVTEVRILATLDAIQQPQMHPINHRSINRTVYALTLTAVWPGGSLGHAAPLFQALLQ